ncbi:DNA-binding response regulator [Amycolatopsis balhimycina DSM 5908]|uniref:DNA-binding response regulator n=1 Tax=Amycolatopsis balhimycina DSM 5908 TaxID=1081091 RepID=A0A428WPB5_AMYBA|nr:response regulator transcription factor [Amycolatopsis balhimycina]RSM44894.1 DNA-binding response regulator [Amycolatopsis balhimycina DSM 5908]
MMRIAIIEDQAMLRSAIVALLELEPDLTVVAERGGGEDLATVLAAEPDVLLLDIEMSGRSGLDVAEFLQQQDNPPMVVMLTTFKRPGYIRRALEAGARAYLTKDAPVSDIAAAIRRVAAGEMLITGDQVKLAMATGANPLSKRERDVLRTSQRYDTIAEIAAELHLSTSTVSNYISEAIAKTDSRNRIQAIRIARENGWL